MARRRFKAKRQKMKGKHSRKLFSKTARKVHHKNVGLRPMRGGIRF